MRTIRISDEVWGKIVEEGKFPETTDDVLRRLLGVNSRTRGTTGGQRHRYATNRMSTKVINDEVLSVSFADGASREFRLPPNHDKEAIRDVLEDALSFAKQHNATIGQLNAVRKALTDTGYHVT